MVGKVRKFLTKASAAGAKILRYFYRDCTIFVNIFKRKKNSFVKKVSIWIDLPKAEHGMKF